MAEERKLDLSALNSQNKETGAGTGDGAGAGDGAGVSKKDDKKVLISINTIKKSNKTKTKEKSVDNKMKTDDTKTDDTKTDDIKPDDTKITADKIINELNAKSDNDGKEENPKEEKTINLGVKKEESKKLINNEDYNEKTSLFSNYKLADKKEGSNTEEKKEHSAEYLSIEAKKVKKKKIIKRILIGIVPVGAIALGFFVLGFFPLGQDLLNGGKADSLGTGTEVDTGAIQGTGITEDEVVIPEDTDDTIIQSEVEKQQQKNNKIREFLKNTYINK